MRRSAHSSAHRLGNPTKLFDRASSHGPERTLISVRARRARRPARRSGISHRSSASRWRHELVLVRHDDGVTDDALAIIAAIQR
jgi:hypothetical protein